MPRNTSSTSRATTQRRRSSSDRSSLSGQQRSRSRNDRERPDNRGFAALSADERHAIASRGGRSTQNRSSTQNRNQSRNPDDNRSWRPDYDDRGYYNQPREESQWRPRNDYDYGREPDRGNGPGRGFASMDPDRRRELASQGGRASHGGQFREDDYRQSQANRGYSGEYRSPSDRRDFDDYDRGRPFSNRERDDFERQRAEGRSWSGADEYRGSGRSQPGDPRYARDDFFDNRGYQSHENEYRGGFNDDYYRSSGRSQRAYDEDEYDEGSRAPVRRDYGDEESRFSGRGRRSSSGR